jgi:hypothetical protein
MRSYVRSLWSVQARAVFISCRPKPEDCGGFCEGVNCATNHKTKPVVYPFRPHISLERPVENNTLKHTLENTPNAPLAISIILNLFIDFKGVIRV